MDTGLFVDGFPSSFTDQDLRELFINHGVVVSAKVVRDPRGRSLAFGYVEMATPHDANTAIQRLHRKALHGSILLVSLNKTNAR
ncbi:MAG: hypothetical protein NTNFB02_28130 [Nitrospira sp.]